MSDNETSPRVSDESVRAKTGRSWAEWFAVLDDAGAGVMSHREIVAHLATLPGVDPWWQQTVTVTYEQARGLRDRHQKADGYEVNGSKTVAVPLAVLFAAWEQPERRSEWLAADALEVRKSTPGKSMRATWTADGSRVDVYFSAKGPDKSQVTLTHGRLASADEAGRIKAFWAERLQRLKSYLTAER